MSEETPGVRALYERTLAERGYRADPAKVINNAIFTQDANSMVIVKNIELYSLCEHHMLPFFGKVHIAYIPNGKIVGLSKLPRVVRDLATACGKQVRVEMRGKETELDRAILEAIKDPLTHIVRNAVDHGIEAPAVRDAAGKHQEGVITLRFEQHGNQLVLECSDDGGGGTSDSTSFSIGPAVFSIWSR